MKCIVCDEGDDYPELERDWPFTCVHCSGTIARHKVAEPRADRDDHNNLQSKAS
jgi:hypothetical protein